MSVIIDHVCLLSGFLMQVASDLDHTCCSCMCLTTLHEITTTTILLFIKDKGSSDPFPLPSCSPHLPPHPLPPHPPSSSSVFPSYISWFYHFGKDFCVCDRLRKKKSPTIEIVTFCLHGQRVLGVSVAGIHPFDL